MTSTIELKDDECAIVIKGDGSCECVVPHPKDPESIVSDSTILMEAVAAAISSHDSHITAILGNFMKDAEYTRPEGGNHGKEN